ncbi:MULTISPECIES: LysR family transcriptional regulator [unclassified Pseudomonas]|uniref:LysR family transcriptional regulator n=1 Tax=unclassified Pseudomonas TaxID=196821 RepID=UPI000BD2FFFC|nr:MULTISPECIES: LysR family transcriptional regulator [unclassified Pseudomonas]PVZ10556.1 DNA-binding transcriptional LysR family regulator [Pseudomonas sp. URIL14HWK12:I12]PVZ21982.1 DNA-binding transcriptional LysR family regulator [Pseudomonas sp. URIL14HWK12:I10]PVZ30935.1 DNA-binding transcriptional LysR family regulator [Pseudomonas sp. URIL14HWK12:I11]SNZ17338.1 DNA-binding transcriptional regulator, LysR family [Pseudomonas sp. URIL14HWK12:I9]
MFDWNDLKFFLELHRSGRLLAAARRLGTTHTTVARHVERIEQALGTTLFVQHAAGHVLTPAGQALVAHAEAMENAALLAEEAITQNLVPLGKVRLGVTEGLGVAFLTPRLNELLACYPGLELDMVAVPRFVSILNREAEISIQLERPQADLLITRKLTDYRLALYASPAYLKQAPPLNSGEQLGQHQWIGYVDDLLFSQELMFLDSFCRSPNVAFRSTSVLAQQFAARAGLGIAVLPNYMAATDPGLVRVLPHEYLQRSYWISSRRELHKAVRLRVVWDALLVLCEKNQDILMAP